MLPPVKNEQDARAIMAAKLGKAVPAHPLWFLKSATSIIGPGEPIRRPGGYTGKIVFEGELGIVIGKLCRRVSASDAPRYIFGYTCINDVTAADLLNESPDFVQWTRADRKSTRLNSSHITRSRMPSSA